MRAPLPAFLGARGALWMGGLTLVALLGGFGVWSVLTSISGAIISSGRIEVAQNRQVVQHPDGGVAAEILVAEGAQVQAGDILIRLDGTLLRSELSILNGQLTEVQARRARLEAERDDSLDMVIPDTLVLTDPDVADQLEGQRRLFVARLETQARTIEQLDKRKAQTMSQIDGIDAQAAALSEQQALITRELADQQSLLDKRLAAARREEASTQLRDIGASELQLIQQQRALSEQVARLDIRAPATGTVLGLQVTTPRAVIRPADPVLYIVPQDRPLIIATQIPPIHVDEVYVGQPVKLMFPAFSARTTPEVDGTVALVSADALTDQSTGASFYRAEIALSAAEAARLGQPLLPGMPVEAFIQTEARTPLAYLLKPFTDYFTQAFRES